MNLKDPVIVAGPAAAPDLALTSLRRQDGQADTEAELAALRHDYEGTLLVEPSSAADLPAIERYADGVVVEWPRDLALLRAAARIGRPVVVRRAPDATLEEWLSAAEHCAAEGNDEVVLYEPGTRTHLPYPVIDLSLVRAAARHRPVLADVSGEPAQGMAALSAGARGLVLGADADAKQVAAARACAALLAPLLGDDVPAAVEDARAAIDRVDAALATLLERRAELAGLVQRLKPVGGFAGRDPGREQRIVAAMAARAPRLGADRIARIMTAVIEAGLQASEDRDLSRA